jgi:hypothetical protein
MQGLVDAREPRLDSGPGILGVNNTTGLATVSGMPTHCYVRTGNNQALAIAFNNRTPHRNGLPVEVGYDKSNPRLFQVLSVRYSYWDDDDSDSYPIPVVGPHHETHEWGGADGGEDIVYSRLRQVLDCLVYPEDPASLTINIKDGIYAVGQTLYYYGGGTLDLTANVPAEGMRYVLIAMNASGPYAVNGTNASSVALTDVPEATDPMDWRIAAVLLKYTDTTITDWPSTKMIVDLRFVGMRKEDTGYKVKLWSGDETLYPATDAGFASAIAVAVSGDTIWLPPATYANSYSIPGGVTVVGAAQSDVVIQGQVTLQASSELQSLSVVRSLNDALTYRAVLGPDNGTAYVKDCWISCTQAGAGAGYGLSCYGRDGDVHVYQSRLFGSDGDVREN